MKDLSKMEKKQRKNVLISVAKELQDLCEFEPSIKTDGKSEKEIMEILKEAYVELTPEDVLSKKAIAVFEFLGFPPVDVVSEEVEEVLPEKVEEVEEIVEEIVEEEPAEKKQEKSKKEKKTEEKSSTKKATKKPKQKKGRERTELGTVVGTGAAAIDLILLRNKNKFVPAEKIAKESKNKLSRIAPHIRHLIKTGRADIEIKRIDQEACYKLKK